MALGPALACSPSGGEEEMIRHYAVDDLEGVLTRSAAAPDTAITINGAPIGRGSGVAIDSEITSDGNGSLRIEAADSTIVRLYDLENIDVEDARLNYRAHLRTQDVEGLVFLEMWCRFPGIGEFFSRALESPLTGTVEWTTQETPFFLREGQNPDLVRLNLVITGPGTVWIDDIVISKTPL
jgi:hypothetical protein